MPHNRRSVDAMRTDTVSVIVAVEDSPRRSRLRRRRQGPPCRPPGDRPGRQPACARRCEQTAYKTASEGCAEAIGNHDNSVKPIAMRTMGHGSLTGPSVPAWASGPASSLPSAPAWSAS